MRSGLAIESMIRSSELWARPPPTRSRGSIIVMASAAQLRRTSCTAVEDPLKPPSTMAMRLGPRTNPAECMAGSPQGRATRMCVRIGYSSRPFLT